MARAAIAMCVVVALGAPARGDPAPEIEPATPAEMLVLGDAAALLFVGLGGVIEWHVYGCDCDTSGGFPLFIMGGSFYATFGPITHAKAGHPGRALASGVLRVGLPIGAVALARSRDWDTGPTLGLATGGVLAAIALDWFVISRAGSDDDYPAFSIYAAPTSGGAIAGIHGSL